MKKLVDNFIDQNFEVLNLQFIASKNRREIRISELSDDLRNMAKTLQIQPLTAKNSNFEKLKESLIKREYAPCKSTDGFNRKMRPLNLITPRTKSTASTGLCKCFKI